MVYVKQYNFIVAGGDGRIDYSGGKLFLTLGNLLNYPIFRNKNTLSFPQKILVTKTVELHYHQCLKLVQINIHLKAVQSVIKKKERTKEDISRFTFFPSPS